MRSWKRSTLILSLFLLCLTCNGQAIKLTKGKPVPFDTAAVMPVDFYRQVRFKVLVSDSLNQGYRKEIDTLRAQVGVYRELNTKLEYMSDRQEAFNQRQAQAFDDLNKKFEEYKTTAEKPPAFKFKDFITNPTTIIILILTGIVIAK